MIPNINWVAVYNRMFLVINVPGPTYLSGPDFLRMAQSVDVGVPNYNQLIQMRQAQAKSTSRKDFYWDIIQGFADEQKIKFFRLIIDTFYDHAREEMDEIKGIIFGGGSGVPTTFIPFNLWNSEKLNLSLKEIDNSIDSRQFNRAVNLAYTCLEGLYKTYIQRYVPSAVGTTDLMQLCKIVKDDVSAKLRLQGQFPDQIVNTIPTLTNAVANSRNGFSEAHFANDSQKWLAVFARDLTNSIGRLLLHFL